LFSRNRKRIQVSKPAILMTIPLKMDHLPMKMLKQILKQNKTKVRTKKLRKMKPIVTMMITSLTKMMISKLRKRNLI